MSAYDAEALLDAVASIRVVTSKLQIILDRIDYCRNHAKRKLYGLLVEGDTGAGKSTVIEIYQSLNRIDDSGRVRKVRFLIGVISSGATVKTVMGDLLKILGDPFPYMGTGPERAARLRSLLVECGVELIFLDEFHHCMGLKEESVLEHRVASELKLIIKITRIPIILFGIPGCEKIFEKERQLSRIYRFRETLERFDWDDPKSRAEALAFLAAYRDEMPFEAVPDFANPDIAFRMVFEGDGNTANLVDLIYDASVCATAEKSMVLEIKHFAQAYENNRYAEHRLGKPNPFTTPRQELDRYVKLKKAHAAAQQTANQAARTFEDRFRGPRIPGTSIRKHKDRPQPRGSH